MTAIGSNWRATLVSDQRGPVVTRQAATRIEAFAHARVLLDEAEDRVWYHGETVGVTVAQDAGG